MPDAMKRCRTRAAVTAQHPGPTHGESSEMCRAGVLQSKIAQPIVRVSRASSCRQSAALALSPCRPINSWTAWMVNGSGSARSAWSSVAIRARDVRAPMSSGGARSCPSRRSLTKWFVRAT
jgi:hypothetical protein